MAVNYRSVVVGRGHIISFLCKREESLRRGPSQVPLRNTCTFFQFRTPGAGLPGCSRGQRSLLCWKWSVGWGQKGGGLGQVPRESPALPEPSFLPLLTSQRARDYVPDFQREGQLCLETGQTGKELRCECEKPLQAGEEERSPGFQAGGYWGSRITGDGVFGVES